MIDALIAGIVAGYGIAVPVGAVAALIVSLTARTSLRIGSAAALGVATADGLYALLAVLAGSSVAALVRPIAAPLRVASALILLGVGVWIAAQALRRHRRGNRTTPADGRSWTPIRAYLGLLGITVLNPATVVYFVALVLGNGASVAGSARAGAAFIVGVLVASASWQLLLAGGGAVLGRRLTSKRGELITGVVSSLIIGALALDVLLHQ